MADRQAHGSAEGDQQRWSHLPNNVILLPPRPVTGDRLPDGGILCHGCHRQVPDNSEPHRGLSAACPHCWAPLAV